MKLLVAVPKPFVTEFFSAQDLSQLRTLASEVRTLEPADLSINEWKNSFETFQPDAVVTCWGTQAIPQLALPKLRYVAHLCGEIRRLVSRDMIEQGLWVTNWGAIHAKPVAEHALLLILSTLRKTTRWTLQIHRENRWPHEALHQTATLIGRRVGIHGFGAIARELIQFLQPFGCHISAYSAGVPEDFMRRHGATPSPSLDALFSQSDVLVEVEALTAATRHSVTGDLLRRLPDGASFINVGRGAVVDESALIQVALEGRLEIALDVFETEPLPVSSQLRGLPNVTLTPHIGGPTADMRRQSGLRTLQNLARFAGGSQPDGLITLEIYDRIT